MTITEFLLARIAEEELVVAAALSEPGYPQFGDTAAEALLGLAESEGADDVAIEYFRRHDPTRVLAECEAKRRIVEACQQVDAEPNAPEALVLADDVLKLLALPYADRPGYEESWRP